MTPVICKFQRPGGEPCANMEFTITLRRAGFLEADGLGVSLPTVISVTTDADGTATVPLAPLNQPYYLLMQEPGAITVGDECPTGTRFMFYVPISENPVRLENLLVTSPTWSQTWDETALQVIIDAKANAQVAADRAEAEADRAVAAAQGVEQYYDLAKVEADKAAASALAAEGSAQASQGSADAAAASAIVAGAEADTATMQAGVATAAAGEATTSKNLAEAAAMAAGASETAAETAHQAAVQAAQAANDHATAADASATAAQDQASLAAGFATSASASAASAETSKDEAKQARDEAVAAAGSLTGSLVDGGAIDLSSGAYPTKPTVSTFWKVTVGGVVAGADGDEYGVGDTLVYSKPLDYFYKIDNTENVSSVNGKTGVVVIGKADVGLPLADNTPDASKPVSAAQQAALDLKVDAEAGKGLSTNDYTSLEKTKLAGIAAGATVNATDAQLRDRATHTGQQLAATISDFAATARQVPLTGLPAATDVVIAASDTVLAAQAKLQGQVAAAKALANGKLSAPLSDGKMYGIKDGVWTEITNTGGGAARAAGELVMVGRRAGIPVGMVAADGQLIGNASTTYPALVAMLQSASPTVPVVTKAVWDSTPTARASWAYDSAADQIRVPDLNGVMPDTLGPLMFRGVPSGGYKGRGYGVIARDQIQNITGTTLTAVNAGMIRGSDGTVTGAFKKGPPVAYGMSYPTSAPYHNIEFDASGSARTGDETWPTHFYGVFAVVLTDVVSSTPGTDTGALAAAVTALNADMVKVKNAVGNRVMGQLVPLPSRKNAPTGVVYADGQLISNAAAQYPDIVTEVQKGAASVLPVVSAADWLADPLNRASWAYDSGTNQLRVPDWNGMSAGAIGPLQFRGDGTLGFAPGKARMDQIQNITGSVEQSDIVGFASTGQFTGAFKASTKNYTYLPNSGAFASKGITFDASGSARTGTETFSKHGVGVWGVVLFGAVNNPGAADAAVLATSFANMGNRIANLEAGGRFEKLWEGLIGDPGNITLTRNLRVGDVIFIRYGDGNNIPTALYPVLELGNKIVLLNGGLTAGGQVRFGASAPNVVQCVAFTAGYAFTQMWALKPGVM